MATKISNFDLYSLIDNMINEDSKEKKDQADKINVSGTKIKNVDDSKRLADDFQEAAEDLDIHNEKAAKEKSKKKGKPMSGGKRKKEDTEIIDDESEEENEEVKTPDDSPTTLKLGDALDYSKFVDDLNKFRAAHSFEDPEISKELKAFYQKLEDEEKKVFYIILKGLIHVTLMGVDGKAARTPAEIKFNIEKVGNIDKEKSRSAERRVAVSRELNKKGSGNKKVDTKMPIDTVTIGNVSDGVIRQDKSKIYEVLRKNA